MELRHEPLLRDIRTLIWLIVGLAIVANTTWRHWLDQPAIESLIEARPVLLARPVWRARKGLAVLGDTGGRDEGGGTAQREKQNRREDHV